jgi:DNA-binding NarL/FixJ family response regulator
MLAEDHRMFREAVRIPLAAEPDMEIVAETSSGAETLLEVARILPDVLVLDVALPDMSGIEVARQVSMQHCDVRIVALSGYIDRLFVEEMFKSGALAYVVKSAGVEELIDAIRAVMKGDRFVSQDISNLLLQPLHGAGNSGAPPVTVLGKREREVLRLLADGHSSAAIAEALEIAASTVGVHRRNIRHKLGLHTTAELTRYAIREGVISR